MAVKKNRTWELLSEIFKSKFDQKHSSFFNSIKQQGIACMDLITAIEVEEIQIDFVLGKGYSDSRIINNKVARNYNTASILDVIDKNPCIKVYSKWGKGPMLKDWKKEVSKINNIINLVSPSMVAGVSAGIEKYPFMLSDWKSKINFQMTNANNYELMEKKSINEIWANIIAFEGQPFLTKTHKEFKYIVLADSSINIIGNKPYNISKTNFEYALIHHPDAAEPGNYCNELMGPSYVWAILNDSRIFKQ